MTSVSPLKRLKALISKTIKDDESGLEVGNSVKILTKDYWDLYYEKYYKVDFIHNFVDAS